MSNITRREFSIAAGAALIAPVVPRAATPDGSKTPILMRTIPGTRESLPAVGLGTASIFDRDDSETRDAARAVLTHLIEGGARLVDTASTYGDAELVLGAAITAGGVSGRLFVATKSESTEVGEVQRSLKRLGVGSVDLLQLHNVRSNNQSLAAFRDWRAQGITRYVGITSTYHRDFDAVSAVLAREKPNFVQIDYSIDDRLAEERILPGAADAGAGVLTALPFGRGRLFRAVKGRDLPDWSREFADNWAQFFLKFLLADERVTAVIPGTSNPLHMDENLTAMRGRLPDAGERRRMIALVEAL